MQGHILSKAMFSDMSDRVLVAVEQLRCRAGLQSSSRGIGGESHVIDDSPFLSFKFMDLVCRFSEQR
jgi:hypothetical protein